MLSARIAIAAGALVVLVASGAAGNETSAPRNTGGIAVVAVGGGPSFWQHVFDSRDLADVPS